MHEFLQDLIRLGAAFCALLTGAIACARPRREQHDVKIKNESIESTQTYNDLGGLLIVQPGKGASCEIRDSRGHFVRNGWGGLLY